MKTINGAPQFESHFEYIKSVNKKLREWAESRRCVRCFHFRNRTIVKSPMCNYLDTNLRTPETFSCAAFSPIETAGDEK